MLLFAVTFSMTFCRFSFFTCLRRRRRRRVSTCPHLTILPFLVVLKPRMVQKVEHCDPFFWSFFEEKFNGFKTFYANIRNLLFFRTGALLFKLNFFRGQDLSLRSLKASTTTARNFLLRSHGILKYQGLFFII